METEGRRVILVKDDELWHKAHLKAMKLKKSLSEVFREFLEKWIKEN